MEASKLVEEWEIVPENGEVTLRPGTIVGGVD